MLIEKIIWYFEILKDVINIIILVVVLYGNIVRLRGGNKFFKMGNVNR